MIRAVLIDLSGTIHIENEVIPGAIEALNKLRKSDLLVKFVSNTSKESKRRLHERLSNLGFQLEANEITTSLSTTRNVIAERNLKPLLVLAPEAIEEFDGLTLKEGEKPNAVVVGLAPTEFHYEKLNDAFRCLLDGGKLIATHVAKYYARKDGLAIGPGCFVKGLEYSAQCQAEVVGKPTETFFKSVLGNIQPEAAVMIGDDVNDDVKGAQLAGLKGILVQTGKYRNGDEGKINPPPFATCKSFVEAVDLILSKKGK